VYSELHEGHFGKVVIVSFLWLALLHVALRATVRHYRTIPVRLSTPSRSDLQKPALE